MLWWHWILFGFVLLAIEFASTTLHVGFFGLGAIFVGVLVGLGWRGPLWGQIVVFTASSLIALLFIRPPLMRRLKMNEAKVVDTLVGEQAIALGEIAPQGIGKAEMRGTTWSTQNVGNTPLAKGQRCTVESVEGLLIRVRAL